MFEALNASLLATETISRAMNSAANATEMAGDEAVQTGVEFGSLGEALDEVDDDAIQMAVGAKAAESAVDELGDESMTSAIQVEALDAALDDLNYSSSGLAATMGPLRGGLSSIAVLASAAIPAIAGLTSALGGLAAAGGAAAAGVGAIAFGGLQRQAENMAAASSEFEDSSEAMQAIFENFGSQLKEATEPLQTAANTEFAMAGLEGAIELVGIASRGFAEMAGTLREVGSMFGSAVLASAPAVFDELDATLTALMPTLTALASAIRDIPQLIAFLRQQAVTLQSELINFGGASVVALAGISRLGTALLEVLLPPLSVLLSGLGKAASALSTLPKPVIAAATAATAAGAAYSWYASTAFSAAVASGTLTSAIASTTVGAYALAAAGYASSAASTLMSTSFNLAAIGAYALAAAEFVATAATQGLTAALATLTLPISASAVAIGALVGAVIGIISYFGLWGDIIGFVKGVWNALVEIVEFAIEVTYGMILAIEDLLGPLTFLLGPLGVVIWTIANLGEIIKFVGGVFDWFMGVVNTVLSTVMGWIDGAVSAIQQLMDWAMSVVNAIPGVSVDFGDVQETVNLDGLKAGEETESAPEDEDKGRTKEESKNHYDFRGANFGDSSQSQVEQTVTEAVRKANSESRAREDGQQF